MEIRKKPVKHTNTVTQNKMSKNTQEILKPFVLSCRYFNLFILLVTFIVAITNSLLRAFLFSLSKRSVMLFM